MRFCAKPFQARFCGDSMGPQAFHGAPVAISEGWPRRSTTHERKRATPGVTPRSAGTRGRSRACEALGARVLGHGGGEEQPGQGEPEEGEGLHVEEQDGGEAHGEPGGPARGAGAVSVRARTKRPQQRRASGSAAR